MIKILMGGSPCTHWSIAQKNNRETEPEGLGWELFKNYLIAKEKFKPDFFLYENNKSAAQPIKDQIAKELGVDLMYINSALVSAQNRQRFYAFNWGVDQPEDRGIVLRDILESGYPFGTNTEEKTYCLTARYYKGVGTSPNKVFDRKEDTMVAEPIRIGDIGSTSQAHRVYSCDGKSVTINAGGGGQGGKTGLYATPVRVGGLPRPNGEISTSQGKRIYSVDGKSVCLSSAQSGGNGDCGAPATGLYAVPSIPDGVKVYEVKNGLITIKGKQYPIKLADGFYIIRKLTPIECERLQTLPDNYTAAVSNAQRYKGLGNGWTAEVIIHILNGALKDVPRDEEIVVLSMYDGIGTGRYCLDKMGFTNVKYFAYEIDKYAKQVSMSNYPDIIQKGDAFDLRNPDWTIGY